MKFGIATMALALITSSSAFSAVHLSVPEQIKIVAVNQQEVNSNFLRNNQTYKLDAGLNTIGVRYTEFFDHQDNTHDIVKSAVVTLQTPELKDGQSYRLALINAPQNFEQAQQYKEQPIVGLYDAQNQLLVQQAGAKDVAQPWFGHTILTKTVDLTTKPESVVQPVVPVQGKSVVAVAPQSVNAVKIEAKDQKMIELWKQASKSERQKFMLWLSEQAN